MGEIAEESDLGNFNEYIIKKKITSSNNIPSRLDDLNGDLEDLLDFVNDLRNNSEEWNPPQPKSDEVIWRYLNFTQLQSILEREALWFSNISSFDDPYEGTLPKANVESEIEKIQSEFDIPGETAEKIHETILGSPSVEIGYVNCWNIGSHQSAALWDQYLSSDEGVAIKTRVSRLKNALTDLDGHLRFGKVVYKDYSTEKITSGKLPRVYHKRKSFEHEDEFRVSQIIENEGTKSIGPGKYISVDVEELIEELYISPTAEDWFRKLIKDVLDTYSIHPIIMESDLYSDPPY